jgi:hypothetical protein
VGGKRSEHRGVLSSHSKTGGNGVMNQEKYWDGRVPERRLKITG